MGNSNGKPVVFTDSVNLNHFRLLRVVGKGAFGKVRIVERKDNGDQFALKYIRKDEVVRSESVRNIIRERRMLEHLRHPFLCNLRYSFQDIEYLYLVVDLMTGGDLRFHISRKTFTEEAVRFWIAELGCAIEYIHTQGIVHRDVKPDNVLLDQDGHVHLADFNVASDFKPDKPLTSKSGTLAYLAPEVYEGKGYSCEVDWWSLGVVFYESIYNKRPFEGHNHESLGQKILRGEPAFPQTNPPVSMPCLHAISSLLEKDRRQRIGAIGFESFTDNPFFREIDFEALVNKEIDPVFRPSSEKTNFDATYDLEELLLEEAPLEARARRQKPREQLKEDATDQEIRAEELHRMIETLFEPFDYTLISPEEAKSRSSETEGRITPTGIATSTAPEPQRPRTAQRDNPPEDIGGLHIITPPGNFASRSRSSTHSPNGSPPLPTVPLEFQLATSEREQREREREQERERSYGIPNTEFAIPRSIPDEYHDYLKDSKSIPHFEAPPIPATVVPPTQPNTSKRRRPTTTGRDRGTGGGSDPGYRSGGGEGSYRSGGGDGSAYQAGNVSARSVSGAIGGSLQPGPSDEPPLPVGSGDERDPKRPSGMLGFLSRKKGRDRSPKAKERGVLGKEGARQIVNS